MTTTVALTVVLLVLAVTNVWVHLGPRRAHLVTGPIAALLLLLVGRMAGLTWLELGLGRETWLRGALVGLVAAGLVAIVYAVAVAVPLTRGAFRDARYRMGPGAALYTSLVAIPLGTVVFEEVAFRGVLWGLLARDFGALAATAASACLFGLWHVLPATDLARARTPAVRAPAGRRRVVIAVLATIAFTTVAGIVFAELRRRSGSLAAPIGLHWATNGFGVLAAARVWASSGSSSGQPRQTDPAARHTGSSSDLAAESQPSWRRIVRRLWSSRS